MGRQDHSGKRDRRHVNRKGYRTSIGYALRMHWNGDQIMSHGKSAGRKLVLVDHAGLGSVRVDMEAFFEFSFWIAEELEDLVAKLAPVAAPNAARDKKRKLDGSRS
ncbi:MAG: hypothetical protein HYV60_17745 [Planctomycetia bacterium]|nr:hypothetical protein [Planctomycetia bacterium]